VKPIERRNASSFAPLDAWHSRNAQRTALSYTVRKRNGSKRSKDIQIKNQLKKGKHESNGKKREEAESEIKQSKESQKATQSIVKQR